MYGARPYRRMALMRIVSESMSAQPPGEMLWRMNSASASRSELTEKRWSNSPLDWRTISAVSASVR